MMHALSTLLAVVALPGLASAVTPDLAANLATDLAAGLGDGLADLVRIAADACEALPLPLLSRWRGSLGGVRVAAWSRRGRREYRVSRAPLARDTPLYVPGWGNTPDDEAAQTLVRALLTKHRRVLVLDTRRAFCRGYLSAAARVRALADALYSLVHASASRGLPPEDVHLIGFSLGAHVVGVAGKLVGANMNAKIGRITALDPARPCFPRGHGLSREDAEFVQVVHTSAGVLGLERPAGHVDVYVSGAGCATPACAHARAWRVYAASVRGALAAARCDGWGELARGACGGNLTAVGYACSRGARGLFLYRSATEANL